MCDNAIQADEVDRCFMCFALVYLSDMPTHLDVAHPEIIDVVGSMEPTKAVAEFGMSWVSYRAITGIDTP